MIISMLKRMESHIPVARFARRCATQSDLIMPHGERLYKRNGKMHFKPTRNYFNGKDEELEKLVDAGYMESRRCGITKESTTYFFTNEGLDWLEEQLHITIRRRK